jgi:hypothetical protein
MNGNINCSPNMVQGDGKGGRNVQQHCKRASGIYGKLLLQFMIQIPNKTDNLAASVWQSSNCQWGIGISEVTGVLGVGLATRGSNGCREIECSPS